MSRENISTMGSCSDFLGLCSDKVPAVLLRILTKAETYLLQNFRWQQSQSGLFIASTVRVEDMPLELDGGEKWGIFQNISGEICKYLAVLQFEGHMCDLDFTLLFMKRTVCLWGMEDKLSYTPTDSLSFSKPSQYFLATLVL